MGLAGARNSAVTGLQSQSTNIAITSDNIANASTVGYKSVKGAFSTLITGSGQANSYSSGGVSISPQTLVEQQGLIESTGRVTDVAISGAGFFAVQDDAGTLLLTRAGSFSVNNKGELTNTAGFKLMGWPLDNDGRRPGEVGNVNTKASESVDSLVIIDTDAASGSASPTSTIKVGMNLNAGQATFQGATVTLVPVSSANSTISSTDIIVPATGMQKGDQFTLTSNSASTTFEYGGFSESKDIAASNIYGANAASTTFTTTNGDLSEGDKFTITTASSGTVTFTFKQSSPDTNNGQFNSLTTLATAINSVNGLSARIANGKLYVSSDVGTEGITFADVSGSNMSEELGFSNEAAAAAGVNRFNTMNGLDILVEDLPQLGSVINNPTSGATIDLFAKDPLQTLTLTKVKTSLSINLQSDDNGLNTPTALIVPTEVDTTGTMVPENSGGTTAGVATLTLSNGTTTGTYTYGGIGATKAISSSSTIFGASDADEDFVNATGGLDTGDTLTFKETNITTGVTHTLALVYGTDFSSLQTLADAIDADSNFTAKVANGKLYISSQNNANNLVNVNGTGITGAQLETAFGGDFTSDGAASTTANIVAPAGTGVSQDITSSTIFGAATSAGVFVDGTGGLDDNDTITFTEDGANSVTLTFDLDLSGAAPKFNSLDTIASALNTDSNFIARVVDGRLYVQSANGVDKAITVSATSGITGAQLAAAFGGSVADTGANTASIATGTTHTQRFSTLEQLDSLIEGTTGFSTTDPTGSNAKIGVSIDANTQITVGGSSNADLLSELGISSGTVGNGFFTEMSLDSTVATTASNAVAGDADATIDVTYNPDDATKNMAGGNITPNFSRNIRVYDALGTGHDFRMSYLKTGTNKWAMEFYALNPSEIANDTNNDGMLASGTLTFNGDGSLATISSTLTSAIDVSWTGGSTATTFVFNLGTAGLPSGTVGATTIGLTDGLRQFDSTYNVDFVEQNGVAAGQFTGISVSEDGTVSAKFSNGQVKSIYKLPIITVANPNALSQKSGNVFAVTDASGDFNIKQAGLGGAGVIVPGALEGSTADIASELTKTIGIQSNYNANATMISTVKAMEEELNRRL